MDTNLALTIIGAVLMLVGVIFNVIPKQVNKKINPDIPVEAESIAATFRVIIGGIAFALGYITFYCRNFPTTQAMTLLCALGVSFIIIALTIISVKPRGFDKNIAFPPVIMFAVLTSIAFYSYNKSSKIDDDVLIVLNHIKTDKNEEFDKILYNDVMVAAREYEVEDPIKQSLNDKAMNSFEVLKPKSMNQDSTWTYIMVADPYVDGGNYMIGKPLVQKYGEEGAKEVFGRWNECFNTGQEVYFSERMK